MRLANALCNAAAVAAAVGGLLLTAPGAHAATTTISAGSETTLIQVLANTYNGGTVTGSIGDASFTWSMATLTRVQDSGGTGSLNLHTGSASGSADDRVWQDGVGVFGVKAIYAGNSQEFGYYTTGSGYVPLITTATVGETAAGGPITGSTLEWVLVTTGSSSTYYYSDNSAPGASSVAQDFDHMVTWEITWTVASGRFGEKSWVIAWEDLPLVSSDKDYQDLVIEISSVPLPSAVWSGLAMLAGLGMFGWVRRRGGAGLV